MKAQSFGILLALAAPVAWAAPAQADYVRATYSGTVAEVGAQAPDGLAVGAPINFDVVFDPANLVDHTASLNNALGGNVFASALFASLSDDPNASLSITVGPVSFTKYDGIQYGTPFGDCNLADCGPDGLGAGNLPAVSYLNGSFGGVHNIFINSQGYSLDADPIAALLSGGFGLDGPGQGPYDFYLGTGDLANPFTQGYAVGNINLATLAIAPVPEPAAWALMIVGLGFAGASLRLRRDRMSITRAMS